MKIIFVLSLFFPLFHLFLYPLLLVILAKLTKKPILNGEINEFPTITVLCPAYNEADVIEEKIKSYLNLNYPKDKLKMIVISDDSIDGTNEIVEKYAKPGYLELVVQKPRRGKQSGHNLVEPTIDSDYVFSTDANSIFEPDCINHLLAVMTSDPRTGLVTGTLKLVSSDGKDSGEGIYWKYESFVKRLESDFYSIIGANGSIFLIKRELFTQVHPASVDDFERTLMVIKKGYRAKYSQDAIVSEEVSKQVSEEHSRKTRIIAQEWHAIIRQRGIFLKPIIGFMLISHKIIKWIFPIFSLGLLISSFMLASTLIYQIFLAGQILFYLIGFIGYFLDNAGYKLTKLVKIPAYIVTMNIAAVNGFFKFLMGKQYATWNTIREEN